MYAIHSRCILTPLSPVTIQTDVAYKLVQVPVGALALHTSGQTHQAVNVLNLSGDLKTLGRKESIITV